MELSTIKNNIRLRAFDVLKLFAIFFVLWGHSIQYFLSSNEFEEPVFRIIYSFHMPLFMMISGYFSLSSMSLKPFSFFKKKFIKLWLPVISWVIILGFLHFIFNSCFFSTSISEWPDLGRETVLWIIGGFYGPLPFWFLKTCFICYLFAYCGTHIKLICNWGVGITIVISQFIPHFLYVDILYPCFVVGMLLKSNPSFFYRICKKYIFLFVGFIIMLCFWSKSFWTYDGPIRDTMINVIHIESPFVIEKIYNLYRIAIGVVGSLAFIGFFNSIIPQDKSGRLLGICSDWGKYTLGIYILQGVILENIMTRFLNFDDMDFVIFNFFVTPIISFIVLVMCVYLSKLINRSQILGFICFGNSKN